MALNEVKVPDIGDFDEVTVIELLVKPGDTVQPEQSLITVESDKASMEIPASSGGVVKELRVQIGDKVKQGSVVLVLEGEGAANEKSESNTAPEQAPSAPAATQTVAPAASTPAPAPAAPAAAAGKRDVLVPNIGDFKDVAVIELLVKVGDTVTAEQSLFTVESDKASMEIPSPAAGVIRELKIKVGDTVNVGDLIAVMDAEGDTTAPATAAPVPAPASVASTAAASAPAGVSHSQTPAPAPASSASPASAVPSHNPTAIAQGLPHASPSVRKFARELGVPLAEVKGSGGKGRITQDDVQNFTRAIMAGSQRTQAQGAAPAAASSGGGNELGLIPWPKIDFSKFGPIERKEMGRIKKISGANLLRNAVMIPAVTNHDDADITELEAFRVQLNKEAEKSKSGVKVTMLAFLIKACVAALKKFPDFNSSLDGDAMVMKQYWHIGFAADTPNGLMVPVLRDADKKGVYQISQEMGELAKKARDGKLGSAEMTGATFTISSLGGIGGRYFTPIINAPEVAILGVCRSQMEPVWNGKEFAPRLMLPLSLTWDHRVIDGASAARFNVYLGEILSDFRRVLL